MNETNWVKANEATGAGFETEGGKSSYAASDRQNLLWKHTVDATNLHEFKETLN